MVYLSAAEYGASLNPPIKRVRVCQLAKARRIVGAYQKDNWIWKIPKGAEILPPPERKGRKRRGVE